MYIYERVLICHSIFLAIVAFLYWLQEFIYEDPRRTSTVTARRAVYCTLIQNWELVTTEKHAQLVCSSSDDDQTRRTFLNSNNNSSNKNNVNNNDNNNNNSNRNNDKTTTATKTKTTFLSICYKFRKLFKIIIKL